MLLRINYFCNRYLETREETRTCTNRQAGTSCTRGLVPMANWREKISHPIRNRYKSFILRLLLTYEVVLLLAITLFVVFEAFCFHRLQPI